MRHLCLLLLLFSVRDCWSYSKCPPDEVLMPCKCHHNSNIQCIQPVNYSLTHIFYSLNEWSTGNLYRHLHHNRLNHRPKNRQKNRVKNEQHYHEFVLENPYMTKLEQNLFGLFCFERIAFVNMFQLNRMHSGVFNGTEKTVKSLIIKGSNQLGIMYVSELFDALSTLVSVVEMHLELENLNYLPNYGFRSLHRGSTLKLQSLRILSSTLTQIPSYAFYDLINIQQINVVSSNGLQHISGHAFNMANQSDEALLIDLRYNQLTNKPFEIDSFAGANRPVILDLSNNNLTKLSEKVFRKFLTINKLNRLVLNGNPFECDCDMSWLVNNRSQYLEQVSDAICDDYAELWRLDEAYFRKCANNTQYMPRLFLRNTVTRHSSASGDIITLLIISLFVAINYF